MSESQAARRAPIAPKEAEPSLEIANVLFMDLVAYSTMTMEDQRVCLRRLQTIVGSTQVFLEAEERKEVLALPTGDGMALVFFGDPRTAAQCAIEVALRIKSDPNGGSPGSGGTLRLRMGLHCGPVYRIDDINTNLNVAGGGINLAQRVMDAGDAGHILVSSAVADVLSQLQGWKDRLVDLGEHPVKHGVKVHFYNLCSAEVGYPEMPSKFKTNQPPDWRNKLPWLFAAMILLTCVGWFYLRKVPATQQPPVSAPALPEKRLEYWITVQRYKDGVPYRQPFQLAKEMVFEENYRVALNIRPLKPAYLYVLDYGPLDPGHNSIDFLYPAVATSASTQAYVDTRVPESGWFVFDSQVGTEKLYLVLSTTPLKDLEAPNNSNNHVIKGHVVIKDPAEVQSLQKRLASWLVAQEDVRKDEDLNRTVIRSSKDVFADLIQFEHQ